ncbi:PAS domain S-box protein [Natronomonas salina]|uniref:PAS domain S-box protein n=1 Tax=Natronomonas salina TaxID=1710540 RepID=UPI0015B76274|nr:PAS domain S-box protein [Natronomonas salina]QLD90267.1 PAS domain S-box protein [Natronomonas salina]
MAGHAGPTGSFPLDTVGDTSAPERYRALLESTQDGLYQLDAGGRIAAVSDGFAELAGYEREELLGAHVETLLEADDVSTAESTIRAMLANDLETATLEVALRRSDGTVLPCRVRLTPIFDDGEFRGTVGVVRDRSAGRPATDDAASTDRALERELEEVFERVDDAFYALDEEFRFTYVNERAEELLETAEADLLGERLDEQFPAATETAAWAAFHEALETQEQVDLEFYFDPLELHVDASVYPSESGLSVYFRDSSERKERERALEESEQRYRTLAEQFPNGAVTMFDEDYRYTLAAGRGFEQIDVVPEELQGQRFDDVWDEETAAALEPVYRAALDGRTASTELAYGGREWVVHGVPITDDDGEVFAGLAMTQEITDRKRLQEQLQGHNRALQRLYEISASGDRSFDERVREVLEVGREYLDLETGFLAAIDRPDGRFEVRYAAGDDDRFQSGIESALSETYCRRTIGSEGLLCVKDAPEEGWSQDPAYDRWALDAYVGGTVTVDGEPYGTLCFADSGPRPAFTDAEKRFVELATQWVSHELERQRRERELSEYREYTDDILDAIDDVFYTLDEAGDVQRWNETLLAVTGYDDETMASMNALDLFAPSDREAVSRAIQNAFETGSARLELPFLTKESEQIPHEFVASRVTAPDGSSRVAGIGRNITERLEHEAELQRHQRQQQVVAELGQLALETDDLDELMCEATTLVAETLGTDYAALLELDTSGDELELREVAGTDADLVGRRVGADGNSQSGYTLGREEPVVVEDLETETRFDPPELLERGDVTSGLSTVVGSVAAPWGVLTAHDTDRREFTDEDVSFVQSVANVLATAIDRLAHERQLAQQRERLEALNSLHEVIQGITDAVIEHSTREEIEQAVCDRLAASDSYRFAWIGEVDTRNQSVLPQASAATDGYLEEIEISIDPDDPRSNGPAGQAYLTGEVQTSQNVQTDARFDPWREHAEHYGFQSSASIPIVHEDTVFGVLNVYAERPYAFAEEERAIIEQVGEIVGHAIAAVERKRALMSDEVLEVEFRIPSVFEALDVPPTDGWIAIDRAVPVGDGEFILYGRVSAGAHDSLRAIADRHHNWESMEIRGDADTESRFEIRASHSPLIEMIAESGGVVESAVFENGDLNGTVHLPQGTDVRQVVDRVESEYPSVELLARRQVERPSGSARETTLALTAELTDRQQTALETAFHGGFFEWPRDSTGEEIAEQLDIAPATFTQHLRTAERKLLEAMFEELPATG